MPDQADVTDKGGTMRLGLYPARLEDGSKVRDAYGTEIAYERHRHRFEVNNAYRERLDAAGMRFSGVSPDGRLVEYIELRDHPWFVATQAHPGAEEPSEPAASAVPRLRRRRCRDHRHATAGAVTAAERLGDGGDHPVTSRAPARRRASASRRAPATPELDRQIADARARTIVVWRGERIGFPSLPERIARLDDRMAREQAVRRLWRGARRAQPAL